MGEQSGDEGPAELGQLELRAGLVEHVAVALEQRHVRVHARPGVLGERLGHERGVDPLVERDLLHRQPERHHVVGRGQGVGVAQVDLLLARRPLVVAELDRDAHALQHHDRAAPEVVRDHVRRVVEIAAGVDRLRLAPRLRLLAQQEELDLGMGVEAESQVGGPAERSLEDMAGVGVGRRPVRHQDVAEHPADRRLAAQRHQLERRRVRLGDHVRLVDPRETLDRGSVEADALGERALQFGRGDRYRLQVAEHVGEPQAHEADVAFLERAQHEFFLPVHGASLPRPCFRRVNAAPWSDETGRSWPRARPTASSRLSPMPWA